VRSPDDAYDKVAYPSFPYPDTHPDRLATMATLHGLTPAPVAKCRVLEIACNEGANLIPMAYAIPGSEFVGFDLAGVPIERGQQRIGELGLSNIRLFQSDLLDISTELGQFDYIVAHGIYSWVPGAVSDRLLALCRELLSPHGVAFVSYNALPGGYLRGMIRQMMLFRVRGIEDPSEKAAAAIAFLHSLLEARAGDDPFRVLIEGQLKRMEKRNPLAIFHDELGEINNPLHFSDFVAHAGRHGLQYLSESELPSAPDPGYRADVQHTLQSTAGDNIVAREQVLDFMRIRMYRETLLCHAERDVRRDFAADSFRRLLVASQATSTSGENQDAKIFTLPGGIKMETAHAGTIALMEQLEAARPRALNFAKLEPTLSEAGFSLDDAGKVLLMRLVVAKMIELRTWNAPLAPAISARPRASAVARQEARTGTHATTLLHLTMSLDDPLVRSFLMLLDGTRDRTALLDALKTAHPNVTLEQLEEGIEPNLRVLYREGMLEA
jgi:methyltransferase-like protein